MDENEIAALCGGKRARERLRMRDDFFEREVKKLDKECRRLAAETEKWQQLANAGIHTERELRTQIRQLSNSSFTTKAWLQAEKELGTIEADTIKRCKQVVEANEWMDGTNAVTIRAIVAALDKLKDEP